ncbi:MAG: hypothetical protein R3C42_00295 [Parvularculaceae bacterium]
MRSIRCGCGSVEALASNGEWELKRRGDGGAAKMTKARALGSDRRDGPGAAPIRIQFHDTTNDWHTCPAGGDIRASNPCSEYLFLDDTACNLASINLLKFKTDEGSDVAAFEHACRLWTLARNLGRDGAIRPRPSPANRSTYRTLGLGYANLGALSWRRAFLISPDSARDRLSPYPRF